MFGLIAGRSLACVLRNPSLFLTFFAGINRLRALFQALFTNPTENIVVALDLLHIFSIAILAARCAKLFFHRYVAAKSVASAKTPIMYADMGI